MQVLVTGGSGFIGSHVVDKLRDKGVDVKVFDIATPLRQNVEFVRGDITSFDELASAIEGIDYVYHIAAVSNINTVIEDPLRSVELNILSTTKVLEAARKCDVKRVLFASSYFVNSLRGHLYTTCKLASEMICKDYYTLYGLPFTVLRYGTAYGPRSRGDDVVSIFTERALLQQPLTIHGDGSQSRNFIYVEDLAEGNVKALKNIAENKTYVLAGPESITIKEVAETVKKLLKDVKIEYTKERLDDSKGEIVSLYEAKKDLGWEPKVDFVSGVKRYIEWRKGLMG